MCLHDNRLTYYYCSTVANYINTIGFQYEDIGQYHFYWIDNYTFCFQLMSRKWTGKVQEPLSHHEMQHILQWSKRAMKVEQLQGQTQLIPVWIIQSMKKSKSEQSHCFAQRITLLLPGHITHFICIHLSS